MDCIFCKIVKGEIPSSKVYENDEILVFNDLNPQAPIHFLVIPKKHIESCNYITEENKDIVGKIFLKIKELSKEMGFFESGYRIINNCNEDGQQTVKHLHFHVLAKRKMTWPPG